MGVPCCVFCVRGEDAEGVGELDVEAERRRVEVQKERESEADWTLKCRESPQKSKSHAWNYILPPILTP